MTPHEFRFLTRKALAIMNEFNEGKPAQSAYVGGEPCDTRISSESMFQESDIIGAIIITLDVI